nr:retrovirus-related Pol polyprotein from transposon TNT 1-94 [Tanacetum cinerariifolium]
MALGYQNPFYLKQAQKKQQSLYDGKVLLENHDPPIVHDSEETLQLAQESRQKMKQLNKEIKLANYTKINHLLGVFVSQSAKSREELYFSNDSKTADVSKTISIPNEEFLDDTTPSVARKFLNEVKSTIVTLQRVVKHRMTLETHNWLSSAHQELHKIVKDENFLIVNQVDARVQNFEIQFLKEAAKFVGDFKYLTKEADDSLTKHKALELEIERLLRVVVSRDIMSVVQKAVVVDTSNLQTELERMKERFENCIIKKENEYAKIWNDWYKKCNECKFDKISYDKAYKDMQQKIERLQAQLGDLKGMFRINPFKTSREAKHVPNKVRVSARTKPITVSQPPVFTKKDVNSDSNGLSSIGIDNTKTRRTHPRSNTKNYRVPSVSKSSRSKNKDVENVISKVVCAMCKQCLISINHDAYLRNYVNGKTSRGKKQKVIQICLWCVDSGCFKHMTGNLKLIINFVWKLMGTVRFRNDHVAAILGFGDLQWGNILITTVYFVEGLGQNLFLVGQFCASDLEVAFRRNACFVRNLEGVDLLKGDRLTNLYTINLHEMSSASPICLMARAYSTKSWLLPQSLSHLNFDTINDLSKNDLVSGLPKFKYHKKHLCHSCEQGKSKRASHPPKPVPNSRQRLHLLHMDLCSPMRIASINGKWYVLVIMDDYSRYTWLHFLRSKDEASECWHLSPNDPVRTPQQNGVVERRNRTLVEAARTMLIFSHAPLFLWAEAIAIVCFTQNHSIIHCRFNKTPYELINSRKPDISFLHVFEALCYPKNDREDIGKLGSKELHKIIRDEIFPIVNQVDARLQNFEIQFLKEAAKFVGDFKSLTNEVDASLAKHKALELEIKRVLKAVVIQDIMIIVQNESVVDTSDLQTEVEHTKERFENCIIKKETEYAKLWNDWYKKYDECKYDKISYDKAYKDMQQKIERLQAQLGDLKGKSKDTSCVSDTQNLVSQKLENENVKLEFQVLNYARENAHLKATYKNLFDSISVSRAQTKTIIASLQNELQSTIYNNAKLRTQLFKKVSDQKDITQDTSKNTKFAKQPIVENLPKIGETNALSKPVTSNSVSTPPESKSVNNDKVIAPGMFRINPSNTSTEEKHVPKTVSASNRTKPITVSQPPVITKKDVNFDLNGLSSTGVDNTKTKRPQPRINTKHDRVPFASKNSQSKNKEAEVEEHHRNLLLSKNNKHISSACNNIQIDSQDVISKVVCAMCKKFLISVNHDKCLRNYVNGKNSHGKKQKAKVSFKENQMKYQPKVTKPKKVESHKSLATPKPRKSRLLLRWSPTGKLFDQEGKIVDSSESDCVNGENACTSNSLEPKIKRFPNSTSLLDRLFRFVYGSQGNANNRTRNEVSTSMILELLHLDLCSPSLVESYGGYSQTSKAYIVLNKETMTIKESLNVIFDKSLPKPKSSSLVEDDRINQHIIQDLNGLPSLQVNISDKGYPKSLKEARGHPIEQVIRELNEMTLRSKTKQA